MGDLDSAPDYLLAQQQVMEALGVVGRALDRAVGVVRDNARDAMLARRHASQLQNRVAELEAERDEARERCREAAQTLVAAIGAAGPEDVEDTARRAAQRIAELEAAAEAAESALEFYGDPTDYRRLADPDDEMPPVIADEGATARDALKALRAALGKEDDRG